MADEKSEQGVDLGLVLRNGFPAALVAMHLTITIKAWLASGAPPSISKILLIIEISILAIAFATRRDAVQVSWKPYDFFVAMFATFGPFLLAFDGSPSLEISAAVVVQTIGVFLAALALLSLNRSFGVLPANRGVSTTGLYKLVRHPIYFSYQIIHLSYLINHPNLFAGTIVLLIFLCQVARIHAEEGLLKQDPAYAEYMKKVRFRLLPPIY